MSSARIVWTDKARRDLRQIVRYLCRYSPQVAEEIGKQVTAATRRLGEFPLSGRAVPELPDAGLREVIVGNYRVIYEPTENDTVEILSVLHSRRLVPPTRRLRG